MKTTTLLLLLVLFISSCKKEDEERFCYQFRVRTEVTRIPNAAPYPIRGDNIYETCDLTEEEALAQALNYASISSSTSNGVTKTTRVFYLTMTKLK
jgi:hypothetical protein